MKNIGYLILAVILFGLAFYIYWITIGTPDEQIGRARHLSPGLRQPPHGLLAFVQAWQPILTAISSLGGILSLFYQIKLWMRRSSD